MKNAKELLKKTKLYDLHVNKLKAALMESFAGYEMPIQYKGLGIVKESLNCRTNAAFFDIGHMGQMRYFKKIKLTFPEYMGKTEFISSKDF